jgi:hypothetical protein
MVRRRDARGDESEEARFLVSSNTVHASGATARRLEEEETPKGRPETRDFQKTHCIFSNNLLFRIAIDNRDPAIYNYPLDRSLIWIAIIDRDPIICKKVPTFFT